MVKIVRGKKVADRSIQALSSEARTIQLPEGGVVAFDMSQDEWKDVDRLTADLGHLDALVLDWMRLNAAVKLVQIELEYFLRKLGFVTRVVPLSPV